MEQELGFSHFLAQMDAVGVGVLILLLSLSVVSWYLIITKSFANFIARRRAKLFLSTFWRFDSLETAHRELRNLVPDTAFANLAKLGVASVAGASLRNSGDPAAAGASSEYLIRTLRNGINQEAARVEGGLTLIATAGSAAPYIGLFGTVWGIYHALIQIGLSGQSTLDKVAGPVGEALIMTALGLAVAIPAVLSYNAFVRQNRIWLTRLEAFSHDLFALLTLRESAHSQHTPRSPAIPETMPAEIRRNAGGC
ncbi:MAG: MotA/TolQ/ExbB proton channel family protein [Nitrosomonas sp.]|nr:MAG: MotA/TolQ/ExbB proton channel family protein [Nitrosomonas sp.]